MKYLLLILFLLFSVSCHEEKFILHKLDTYKIKKGNHGSGFHVNVLTENQLVFDAIFDNSAIYTTKDPVNQSDINKLLGFADCQTILHHENSARFGWNWQDSLCIYAYCYVDGEVKNKFISSIKVNTKHHYRIYAYNHKYIFYLDNKVVEMDRGCNLGTGYILFPYFGGNEKSPHDIKILIKTY